MVRQQLHQKLMMLYKSSNVWYNYTKNTEIGKECFVLKDKILGIVQTILGAILFIVLIVSLIIGKIPQMHPMVIVAILLSIINIAYGIYLIIVNKKELKKEETSN